MALRIEDYALVGDCRTAALIGRDGSIDWLCWPRFDSAACFAALLGTPEHGRWLITAADPNAKVTRRYRDGTLILETDFETPDGAVTLIDFMPVGGEASHVARIVIGRRGQLAMHRPGMRMCAKHSGPPRAQGRVIIAPGIVETERLATPCRSKLR